MASDMNFDGPLAELEHVLAAQPTLERRAAKGRSREHGMQQSAPEAVEAVAPVPISLHWIFHYMD